MTTDIFIYNLNGNRAAVRDYANTIASMSASNSNAYVMAFDKDNEILWTVQAGDDLDEVKAVINWQAVDDKGVFCAAPTKKECQRKVNVMRKAGRYSSSLDKSMRKVLPQ